MKPNLPAGGGGGQGCRSGGVLSEEKKAPTSSHCKLGDCLVGRDGGRWATGIQKDNYDMTTERSVFLMSAKSANFEELWQQTLEVEERGGR